MTTENLNPIPNEQLGEIYSQVIDGVSEKLTNEYVQAALSGNEESHHLHPDAQEILSDKDFPKSGYDLSTEAAKAHINLLKVELANGIDNGILNEQDKQKIRNEIIQKEKQLRLDEQLNVEERLRAGELFQSKLYKRVHQNILDMFIDPLDFYADPNLAYPAKLIVEEPNVKTDTKDESKPKAIEAGTDKTKPDIVGIAGEVKPKTSSGDIPSSDKKEPVAEKPVHTKPAVKIEPTESKSSIEDVIKNWGEVRTNLDNARTKFANISLKKARLVRRHSQRANTINREYDELAAEYRNTLNAFLELKGIKNVQELTDLTIKEFEEFNKTQLKALENENGRVARVSRWLSKHHVLFNLISGSTLGVGSSLVFKNAFKGMAALGVGIATPISIGVGIASRAARTSIMGIVGSRNFQKDQLRERKDEELKTLKGALKKNGKNILYSSASELKKVTEENSAVAIDSIWKAIDERVRGTQKINRERIIKSALFAGAAGLAGSVLVEYAQSGTNVINAIHHPTPSQLRDIEGLAGTAGGIGIVIKFYKRFQQWSNSPVSKEEGRPGLVRGSYIATKGAIKRVRDY